MTLKHSYQVSDKRNIFRLRAQTDRPDHGHDLKAGTPADYADLNEAEKEGVAEFIAFLVWREEETGEARDHFYMRDHDNRPQTTELEIGEDMPAGYADLNEEDRFHVHEFIQFIVIRRRNDMPEGES